MTLSGIQDFNGLQSGFPIKIASGMTIGETITLQPCDFGGGFMDADDIKKIEEIFKHHIGVMSEDFQHKLDIVAEGHQMLGDKIDRMEERLGGVEGRLERVELRLDRVESKVDA